MYIVGLGSVHLIGDEMPADRWKRDDGLGRIGTDRDRAVHSNVRTWLDVEIVRPEIHRRLDVKVNGDAGTCASIGDLAEKCALVG